MVETKYHPVKWPMDLFDRMRKAVKKEDNNSVGHFIKTAVKEKLDGVAVEGFTKRTPLKDKKGKVIGLLLHN